MIHSLRTRSRHVFIAAVAASVAAAAAAWSAYATSGTGTQNPELTVYVSITPDCITPGSLSTRIFSVTNNTARGQPVTLQHVITHDGVMILSASSKISLRPHQTWFGEQRTVLDSSALGTYTEMRSATDSDGTSSATATYKVAMACP